MARRGALSASIRVSKVVRGVKREVVVGVVNTHLATWYDPTEEKWSKVREEQGEEVLEAVARATTTADLVVVGGDLNSSPASPTVEGLLGGGLIDTLADLKDEGKAEESMFHTWGNSANSWTAEEEGSRIDYLLYRESGGRVAARTSMYRTLDASSQGTSISDHMGVEANLRITFN